MLKVVISGYGRLGKALEKTAKKQLQVQVVGIINKDPNSDVKQEVQAIKGDVDVVIDFSHHSKTKTLLTLAKEQQWPLVLATTGHSKAMLKYIHESAQEIPILLAPNTSLGVNILAMAIKQVNQLLNYQADIEIIEHHHAYKEDAPSGTAKMLFDQLNEEHQYQATYRSAEHKRREQQDIGIHSIRAGSIFGKHSVLFGLKDETITLTHEASSIELFTNGALQGAGFIYQKQKGLFSMQDVLTKK